MHQGYMAIGDALIKNSTMMSIELNDNFVGDAGCLAFAKALQANTVLLNGNNIGIVGVTALSETLRINASLKELGLGRNEIGNDGPWKSSVRSTRRCNDSTRAVLYQLLQTLQALVQNHYKICSSLSSSLLVSFAIRLSSCKVRRLALCLRMHQPHPAFFDVGGAAVGSKEEEVSKEEEEAMRQGEPAVSVDRP
jgi:Leucine Rich repeat